MSSSPHPSVIRPHSETAKQAVFLGVDIGKERHTYCMLSARLLKRAGGRYQRCPHDDIGNDRAGFERLLNRARAEAAGGRIHLLLEHTGHYGYLMEQFFQEQPDAFLYRTLPGRYGKNKNDLRDAQGLATRLYNQVALHAQITNRLERVWRLQPPLAHVVGLYELVRRRIDLTHAIVTCKNRLRAVLDQLFPEFTSAIKDIFTLTALDLREWYPTAQAIAEAQIDDLLRMRVRNKPGRPTYERLQTLARESVGVKPGERQRSLVLEQSQLIIEYRFLQSQDAELAAQIAPFLKCREGQILLSITGVGPVYGAQLLAGIGNIRNFPTRGRLRAYMGWSPKQAQSGKSKGKEKLDRAGNKLCKIALYGVAHEAILHSPKYKRLYNRLIEERHFDKKHATIQVAGQIVSAIYRLLWQDSELVRAYRGREEELPPPVLYVEEHMPRRHL